MDAANLTEDEVSTDSSLDIIESTFCLGSNGVVISSSDTSTVDLSNEDSFRFPRKKTYVLSESEDENVCDDKVADAGNSSKGISLEADNSNETKSINSNDPISLSLSDKQDSDDNVESNREDRNENDKTSISRNDDSYLEDVIKNLSNLNGPTCNEEENRKCDLSNEVNPVNDLADAVNSIRKLNISDDSSRVNESNVEQNQLLAEKERLTAEIAEVRNSMKNKSSTLRSVDLNILPDKGLKLKVSIARDERSLEQLNEQYERVNRRLSTLLKKNSNEGNKKVFEKGLATLPSVNINDMGKRALETFNVQQSLTVHSLRQLHNSLRSCPSDDTVVSDPVCLKLPLMLHQQQALGWLLWREQEKPPGGILADDMGLGKTLTMISLVLKANEDSKEESSDSDDDDDVAMNSGKCYNGGTLIVCPSSLLGQWEFEITSKVVSGSLSYQLFHGPNRERKARRLARPDIVITTYAVVRVESEKRLGKASACESVLYGVKWSRIILDEAHVIRNHKSKTSIAVCELKGKHRWALTGTPVHNKMQDFYSLIKFLRCKPFNDLNVWKKWVEAKDETGAQRLNMLVKSLLLRRTKLKLIEDGKMETLPEKSFETILIQLGENEMKLYEQVSNLSKTLLCELLYQRAEKENLATGGFPVKQAKQSNIIPEENPFTDHPALGKLFNRVKNMENIKTHEILVLLLRLRQICCHPALIKSMIEKDAFMQDNIQDEDGLDIDLLEKMSAMNMNENEQCGNSESSVSSGNKIWDANNPIFSTTSKSSKIAAVMNLLEENLLKTEDRIVIVSQWTSMLEILHDYLKKVKNCRCDYLTGSVPVPDRMQIVKNFNKKSSNMKVLLLSMMAGGTGLNLVGANHLILTDIHWNPQIEAQACDRIYRVGQKKNVKIYKFICSDTIEEKIQVLQQKKLEVADTVLSGAKQARSQLTLNDLKMLFGVS